MKFLLIAAAVCAMAVAGPTRFVSPGITGPAPIIDWESPISVGPAIIDPPISVGPAIVGPGIVDDSESPISVGPAIVGEAPKAPLVQVIINVKPGAFPGNPVVVDKPEIKPTPVIVVDQPEIEPTPVIVVDKPEIKPEPVIIAPIVPVPVVTLPGILN